MVYEWGARTYLRTSPDGVNWSASTRIPGTGMWLHDQTYCAPYETVNPHPFAADNIQYGDCLVGAPPGIYVEGDNLYVFVGLGEDPGHMGCFVGPLESGAAGLRRCSTPVLFTGATEYGPLDKADASANPYFDFRTISSADVIRVGDHDYMTYEGVRGPTQGAPGDNQYNLGFARSIGSTPDGPWEKYPANPILADVPGNVGIGHADLVVLDGATYLYTATSTSSRGRYLLVWNP